MRYEKRSMKNDEPKNVLAEAPQRAMPRNVRPMLATLAEAPFDGDGWLFEVKWDGYRAIAEVRSRSVRLYSRNLLSYEERFAPVVESLRRLGREALLDGEVVVLDDSGRPNFQWLQVWHRERRGQLVYCVFDLLHLDGHDLTGLPLLTRKQLLQELIAGVPGLTLSEHVEHDGKAFFRAAAEAGLEGIVAKKANSHYRVGVRSRDWLKLKARQRQEVVIGGFTQGRGSRQYFGSLLLGVYDQGKFVNVGHVGTGFDEATLAEVHARLEPLVQPKCPFAVRPKTNAPARWVKPELVCEVAFTEWTEDGHIRHPVFMGLRDDKPASAVRREMPMRGAGA